MFSTFSSLLLLCCFGFPFDLLADVSHLGLVFSVHIFRLSMRAKSPWSLLSIVCSLRAAVTAVCCSSTSLFVCDCRHRRRMLLLKYACHIFSCCRRRRRVLLLKYLRFIVCCIIVCCRSSISDSSCTAADVVIVCCRANGLPANFSYQIHHIFARFPGVFPDESGSSRGFIDVERLVYLVFLSKFCY